MGKTIGECDICGGTGMAPTRPGKGMCAMCEVVLLEAEVARATKDRDEWARRSAKWALELDGPNGNDGLRAQFKAAREALENECGKCEHKETKIRDGNCIFSCCPLAPFRAALVPKPEPGAKP